MIAKEVPF